MQAQPYTYLIGWSSLNKWYYGVRWAKGCHPSDFWIKYFTSSVTVRQFVSQYGDPDIRMIRKIFDNKHTAMSWERRVLRRMKVMHEDKWLNKHIPGSPWKNMGYMPEETKTKISITINSRDNTWSDEKKARHAEQYKRNWPNYAEKHQLSVQNCGWITSPDLTQSKYLKKDSTEYQSLTSMGWSKGRKAFKPKNKIENKPPKIYKTKEEISEINRQSQLGLKRSAEAVEKTAEKNRKSYWITHPCGKEELVHGLAKFCRDHGLTCSLMVRVANGQQTHHKGYKIKRT
jgi:hypothetical protein